MSQDTKDSLGACDSLIVDDETSSTLNGKTSLTEINEDKENENGNIDCVNELDHHDEEGSNGNKSDLNHHNSDTFDKNDLNQIIDENIDEAAIDPDELIILPPSLLWKGLRIIPFIVFN